MVSDELFPPDPALWEPIPDAPGSLWWEDHQAMARQAGRHWLSVEIGIYPIQADEDRRIMALAARLLDIASRRLGH